MCFNNSSPDACKQIKKQILLNKVPRRWCCLMSYAMEKINILIQHATWGQDLMGNTGGFWQCPNLMKQRTKMDVSDLEQLAKQKTNIARQIPERHGENMHHGQVATRGGGGVLTADLMNPRSKMKIGTCLGQSAIATTACCSGRSRRRPGNSVTAAREPISVERGSGAPNGAQKPSINQRTTQMEDLAPNQSPHNTKGR